jgi:transcriptional regulator with XRE-family HTH domain
MVGQEAVFQSIGANVRRIRDRRGVTQQALAELADLDHRFVQRVERGKTNMSVLVLAKLARALGVVPAALLKSAKIKAPVSGRPRRVRQRVSR